MQNCLFTFVLCLVPSAWLIYFCQNFSIARGFVLYTLCLAVLLTSIVRLWLHNLELEKRVHALEQKKTDAPKGV